ncbi:MAG: hypothetical protein ABI947_26225 [Chloroflexota bacterium]
MTSTQNEPTQDSDMPPSRWRENLIALLLCLAILGLIVLSAGGGTPFVYGRF